jgi:uncharacterized protein (TIGR03437 family)
VYVADTGNNAVRLLQSSGGGETIAAVTNAASNATGPIAPGEILVLYGSGLGPANTVSNPGPLTTSLGGTVVYINGVPAPVLYAGATQVSVIVPFAATGTQAQIYVSYAGQASNVVTVPILAAAPGLFTVDFTGKGQVAAINVPLAGTNTVNGASHPANGGDFIELFGTGGGPTNPVSADGAMAPAPAQLVQPATVTIGGKPASVNYAGAAPGDINGLLQINVQIPTGLPAGPAALTVSIAGINGPTGTTIYVSGK